MLWCSPFHVQPSFPTPICQAEFDHVKKGLHADEEERAAEEADPMFYIRGATEDTKRALEGKPKGG